MNEVLDLAAKKLKQVDQPGRREFEPPHPETLEEPKS